MKRCNFIMSLALLFTIMLFFSSCESSKVAFGNSYYFKQTPKKIEEKNVASEGMSPTSEQENATVPQMEEQAYASTEIIATEKSLQEKIEQVEQRVERMKALKKQEEERKVNNITLSKAEKRAFRKEKKAEQKELKKELKALAKEYKKAPEEVKKQSDVSGNLRTGIILGAAGLVLLIIGSGNPILYALGTVLVVVGVVLILIDVL